METLKRWGTGRSFSLGLIERDAANRTEKILRSRGREVRDFDWLSKAMNCALVSSLLVLWHHFFVVNKRWIPTTFMWENYEISHEQVLIVHCSGNFLRRFVPNFLSLLSFHRAFILSPPSSLFFSVEPLRRFANYPLTLVILSLSLTLNFEQ